MDVPLASLATQVADGVAPVLHHWAEVQLLSSTQAFPHAPLASQTVPACVAPEALHVVVPPAVPHVAHAPPAPGQYGANAGQGALVVVPLSPLQATQVSVTASQIGVAALQVLALLVVHCWQRPLPPFSAVSQTPLRHTPLEPEAFAVLHGPEPFGSPQTLSLAQTPLKQRSVVPAAQVPPPGIGEPVAPWALQVWAVVSQYCFAAQSPSALHPVAERQTPFTEHTPLWQALGFVTVHVPSPSA